MTVRTNHQKKNKKKTVRLIAMTNPSVSMGDTKDIDSSIQ